MFLLTVLVLTVLCGAVLAPDSHTYRRTDPQQLLCDRCPPGTRLRAHCTRFSQTECAPCGAGLFTESWNYIPDCLRCDACSDHQRVDLACNATVNAVCECVKFFWDQYLCRRHSVYKPGHGVKAPGVLDLLKPVVSSVFTRDWDEGDAITERLQKIVMRCLHRKRAGSHT